MADVILVMVGVMALVGAVAIWSWFSQPETWRRLAQAERDLHAARRSREVSEFKRQVRDDAHRLRHELERELRDINE